MIFGETTPSVVRDFVFCFLSVYFFGYVLSLPKSAKLAAPIISAAGFVVFRLSPYPAFLTYFVVAAVLSALSEMLAVFTKTPSVVFIYPAIIPFVPGLGLYQTMLALIKGDYPNFAQNAGETLFIAIVIAFATAISKYILAIGAKTSISQKLKKFLAFFHKMC